MWATRPLFRFCGGTPPTTPRHGGSAPLDPPFSHPRWLKVGAKEGFGPDFGEILQVFFIGDIFNEVLVKLAATFNPSYGSRLQDQQGGTRFSSVKEGSRLIDGRSQCIGRQGPFPIVQISLVGVPGDLAQLCPDLSLQRAEVDFGGLLLGRSGGCQKILYRLNGLRVDNCWRFYYHLFQPEPAGSKPKSLCIYLRF
jgi:hypothetical protein